MFMSSKDLNEKTCEITGGGYKVSKMAVQMKLRCILHILQLFGHY